MGSIKPNQKQQQAIDILDGQVMLLAGPGTGKTFTVIHRIENMLSNKVNPSSILCLTFSDAAANEMRQRLIKKMGVVASSVDIYTYHSFCNTIIGTYPDEFELTKGVRLISKTEQLTLIKECIDEIKPQFFVPQNADRYYFAPDFINHIGKLKAGRLTKEQYFDCLETNETLLPELKRIKAEIYEREQAGKMQNKGRYDAVEKIEKNIEKAKDLWNLYEAYRQKMLKNNLIDFSDMINFVLDAFENDFDFLKKVSNKYKYFLVDEYQDTNDLQNNIIFNLLDGNDEKNIFVVGDDDQIIYGFQGARIDSIENFLNRYPDTKVICLDESNRSTTSILDFSYKVISQDEKRLENNPTFEAKKITKKLIAKNQSVAEKDKKVRLLHFGEFIQEINTIVEDIEKLVESNECPVNNEGQKDLSKIAILSKKRNLLYTCMELLKNKNIACQIDEGKSIFAIRSSILAYFYLKALNNHFLASDKLFGLMLAEPFKLNLKDYNKILEQKRLKHSKVDFITLMQNLDDWEDKTKITNFLKTFKYLQKYSSVNNLRNTIVEIFNKTDMLAYFCGEEKNKMENIYGLKKILEEATNFIQTDPTRGLNEFVTYLDDCIANDIEITTDSKGLIQNAVQLTTYHSSKGREFEHVYLPDLTAKNWENFAMRGEYKLITDKVLDKDTEQEKKDSELLKLLFVGITRAKHSLTLSFADNNDGKSQQITKYLADIDKNVFDEETFEYGENDFTVEFEKNISRETFDNQKEFTNEIMARINNLVLSPSRLNDYQNCPRNFFYSKILEINIEEADWDSANYGSLVHSLLENAVKTAKETGSYPDKRQIKTMFDKHMSETIFTDEAKREKFEKSGNKMIEEFYPHFVQFSPNSIEDIEFSFNGIEIDGNMLTGKIDRIEKNSDGTYSLFDYKTSRPVSKNQIAPEKAREEYFNQLCFYKCAFEKLTGKKVAETGIIFIEDYTKNVRLELTDNDMIYIRNKISETYKNIKDLKFNPTSQKDNKTCVFCAYKHLCTLDVI